MTKTASIADFLDRARKIVAEHKAQYQGIYYLFGGSSPSGTTNTIQNTNPWAGQAPFLSGTNNPNLPTNANGPDANPVSVFNAAEQLYSNPSEYPQYYPDSTVAPLNSAENGALSGLESNGMYSPLLNTDENTQQAILSGQMLSQGNPYQQAELNSINSQITPQIESQFTQGNAMNNPAAAFATGQGVASADAQVAGQNYNNAQTQLTQESLYAPQTYAQQLSGQNTALAAGQAQQNQAQQELNNQVNAYNYNEALPFNMLNQFGQEISGSYGGTSTLTSPYYNNNASNILSGGLGVAAMAPSISGLYSALLGSSAASAGSAGVADVGSALLPEFAMGGF